MANVTKCDICGKIFDYRDEPFVPYGSVTMHKSRHDFGDRTDCCPECTDKINAYIDVLKTGLTHQIYVCEVKGD